MFVCLSFVCLSVCAFVSMFVSLSYCMYVRVFVCVCMFVSLSYCMYVCVFVCVCMFVSLSYCMYVRMFVCVCMFVFSMSVYVFVCLFVQICGIGKVTEKMLNALDITLCRHLYEKRDVLHLLFSQTTSRFFLAVSLGIASTVVQRWVRQTPTLGVL